jgi:hypothetical protein
MKALGKSLLMVAALGGWALAAVQFLNNGQAIAQADFAKDVVKIVEQCKVHSEAEVRKVDPSKDLETGSIVCPKHLKGFSL